jgi:hypothetical protein
MEVVRMCRAYLLICVFLGLTVSACKDPYDYRISGDISQLQSDEGLKKAVSKLNVPDSVLIARYLMRVGLRQAFGKQAPQDRTIRQAIDEQRQIEAASAAREAETRALAERVEKERAEAVRVMNEVLVVALTGLQYHDSDFMHGVDAGFSVGFALKNKSNRDLAGVKGEVRFADIFNDEIKTIKLSIDDGIAAGQTVSWRGGLGYNQFMAEDKKLRFTAVEKLKASWLPKTYLFADGSRMDVPQ